MLEILMWSAIGGSGLAVLATATVALLRDRGLVGPLIEAEKRRSLWLRVLALVAWLTLVAFSAWYLNVFLATIHEWVGYGVGALVAAALAALGIGVALL